MSRARDASHETHLTLSRSWEFFALEPLFDYERLARAHTQKVQ